MIELADAGNRLELSPADVSGIRNALLEAVTDLRFSGDANRDQLARGLLTALSEPANRSAVSDSRALLERGPSYLHIRHATEVGSNYELALSADVVEILHEAVEHVLDSLLDFELPIRVRLTQEDLTRLSRELSGLRERD